MSVDFYMESLIYLEKNVAFKMEKVGQVFSKVTDIWILYIF
jgi:hypothetical protein